MGVLAMKQELRDIIVVIPGILGSVLEKDGVELWGPSLGAIRRGLFTAGLAEHLTLPEERLDGEDMPGGVAATRLIGLPRVLAGLAKTDGYDALRQMIAASFNTVPVTLTQPVGNYIEFPYDWRRDNRHAARRLQEVIERALREWRNYSGIEGARAVIIAHSMGGLVGRYYAEVLGGWRDCRALITLATPHRGAAKAVNFLANGPGWPLRWLADIGRTFPSIYQLLPIYEMLDVQGALRRVAETTDLPGIDPAMARSAFLFHREIESAVGRNRQDAGYHERFRTIPVVGTNQPTIQSSALVGGRIAASEGLPRGIDPLFGGGDGTVPRLSATPIELSGDAREYFLPECHAMIQGNRHLLDSLRELLLHLQSRGLEAIRGPATLGGARGAAAISIRVGDLYAAGEPVVIRADVRDADEAHRSLEGVVTSVDPAGMTWHGPLIDTGDGQAWTVGALPEGVYRVEVRPVRGGPLAPAAVHDVFEVTPTQGLEPS
jgi:pimeloyl-ACP methyl ester carboxylesterase